MSQRSYKFIKLEKKGKICILELNRPEKKNAMNMEMRTEIITALNDLKLDKRIKCVIFYGGREFFSAGFDRDEVLAVVQSKENIDQFVENNHNFHQTILDYPKLLIAAINGFALAGAFDLAIICHLRIASKNAIFGHPEIRFGACPLFFPYMAIVGRGKALEIALNTGTRDTFLSGTEAYQLNLVNKLVEPGEVLNEAIKMAKQIYQSPELAITQLIKVSNTFFNQVNIFDAEIDTILETVETSKA
ncbi:MAG: enoyl-CoA hydratase/isomerase family protein [Candidatus Odinarchaeota archaeon]